MRAGTHYGMAGLGIPVSVANMVVALGTEAGNSSSGGKHGGQQRTAPLTRSYTPPSIPADGCPAVRRLPVIASSSRPRLTPTPFPHARPAGQGLPEARPGYAVSALRPRAHGAVRGYLQALQRAGAGAGSRRGGKAPGRQLGSAQPGSRGIKGRGEQTRRKGRVWKGGLARMGLADCCIVATVRGRQRVVCWGLDAIAWSRWGPC